MSRELNRIIDIFLYKKFRIPWSSEIIRSILAGLYIGLGCLFMVFIKTDKAMSSMLNSLLSGIVFSIGLWLVICAQGELFTGNCLMFSYFNRYDVAVNKGHSLPKILIINYIFNFVGICFVAMIAQALGFNTLKTITIIANDKFSKDVITLFISGLLCNILVCLAVWVCSNCRTTLEKLFSIIFPVTMFVACGFEHSIADMFFMWFTNGIPVQEVVIKLLIISFGNLTGGILISEMLFNANMER